MRIGLPDPKCNKDCRFLTGPSTTTAVYYPPTFDKNGNNLNPDGNITTTPVVCTVCGTSWTATTQYGKTSYEKVR